MRKLNFVLALTLFAVPLFAASSGRSHSYFTYDDGGTIIKQGEDGREIEARVNLPLFPGDEVTTNRRGRAEIRLADGNVIALDRATIVRFVSILDSYDGDSSQTVVELRAGHAIVQRDDDTHQLLRLDTQSASYAATGNAIYAVEFDTRGGDRVTVFDGSIEVRTPTRTTRVREGEEARVDEQGIYDLASRRASTDDFERWFLRRSEKYRTASSRYLDRSLAYSEDELSSYGTWQFVAGYNSWAWRPRVATGWRPYYNGSWHNGPSGCLVWASYEPWGWVPYHYGRWAYDGLYGWVWLPGVGYAPAWVYWMYGPSYIGWAPMGWYDCYRPYYNWAYRPYSRAGFGFDYGWYGRVNVGNIDLRPWTFVQPNSLIARRVDQAAVSTEIVRARLLRGGGDSPFATVSSAPARFSRNEIKDPTAAVNVIARRGIGSGTGKEGSGVATDLTPFFRRDPELSNSIRERVARTYRSDQSLAAPVGAPSGVPSPGTAGTLEGRVPTDSGGRVRSETGQGGILNRGGTVGGTIGGWRNEEPNAPRAQAPGGTVRRDETPSSSPAAPSTSGEAATRERSQWRERVTRPAAPSTPSAEPQTSQPSQDWRGRTTGRRGGDSSGTSSPSTGSERGSEVPRRIIDSIGGGRISTGDRERSSAPRDTAAPRDSSPSRDSSPKRESAPRDSGRVERSSPPPSQSHSSAPPPSSSSSSPAPRSQDGGGSGRIKRD
ncbi:MAG: FecR family protein [Acidobacteriota bacterium]